MNTTDLYTLAPSQGSSSKHKQLRDLNSYTQPIQEALNHAQASVTRAMLLVQREYMARRQQIIAAHDETESI